MGASSYSAQRHINSIISGMIKRLICLIALLILAACGSDPQAVGELPTVAQLPTATDTPLPSPTPIASWTPTESETPTPTALLTETATVTPSATITDTPSPTPTDTPTLTPEPRAVNSLLELAMQATVLPQQVIAAPTQPFDDSGLPTVVGPVSCPFPPPGGFNPIFNSDPNLIQQIGCPQGDPPTGLNAEAAWQEFEGGFMLWLQGPVYVLYNGGRFRRFEDTYDPETDPPSGGETPPTGRLEPVRGFGKVWRENPNVRQGLGWAYSGESGLQAVYQPFDRGLMLALPQRTQIIIIAAEEASGASGSWRSLVGSY